EVADPIQSEFALEVRMRRPLDDFRVIGPDTGLKRSGRYFFAVLVKQAIVHGHMDFARTAVETNRFVPEEERLTDRDADGGRRLARGIMEEADGDDGELGRLADELALKGGGFLREAVLDADGQGVGAGRKIGTKVHLGFPKKSAAAQC